MKTLPIQRLAALRDARIITLLEFVNEARRCEGLPPLVEIQNG